RGTIEGPGPNFDMPDGASPGAARASKVLKECIHPLDWCEQATPVGIEVEYLIRPGKFGLRSAVTIVIYVHSPLDRNLLVCPEPNEIVNSDALDRRKGHHACVREAPLQVVGKHRRLIGLK